MQWYYSKNDTPSGPVDDAEFRRLAQSGEITKETLVWNATMGDQWQPASSFSFLFFAPVDLQPPAILNESESASGPQGDGTTPNRYLVSRARASLSGKWGMAVLTMILYSILTFVIGGAQMGLEHPARVHAQQAQIAAMAAAQQHHQTITLSKIITQILYPKLDLPLGTRIASDGLQFLQYLLAGPFAVGLCFFLLNIAHRSEAKITDIFKGFSLFWKAVGAYFLLLLIMFFWALLFMLPAIGFLIWKKIDIFHEQYPNSPVFVLLCIAAIILLMIQWLSYTMTFFVLADDPTTGPLQAIRKSTAMMSCRKWKYICLQLRFLGWWFLSLFTCNIGLLWLIPYIKTAEAHFYLDVKDRAALPKE